MIFSRSGCRPGPNPEQFFPVVRTARAAAGRRSGKTAAPQKRWRRVNNRRSWSFSLEPFAGVGVAYRHREEAQTEGQHDDVQHEMLLAALVFGAQLLRVFGKVDCYGSIRGSDAIPAFPVSVAVSATPRICFRDRRGTDVI